MRDIAWRIRTRANGTIIADGLVDSFPQYQRGETTTLRFLFRSGSSYGATAAGDDGWTYGNDPATSDGGDDHGATWGGQHGALFGPADKSNDDVERYRQLREYLDWAGASATGESYASVPWYREQLPSRADVASEVVAIEPPPALANELPGLWGLIVGGSDDSQRPGATIVSLDVLVLAERDEYDDHSALESDLAA